MDVLNVKRCKWNFSLANHFERENKNKRNNLYYSFIVS